MSGIKWLIFLVLVAGCGKSAATESCGALLEDIDAEKADALACDPNVAGQCSGQAPVVVSAQADDGGIALEALASNCNHAVNATRSATLQELLGRYQAQGCKTELIPICQPIVNQCRAGADGGFSCAP